MGRSFHLSWDYPPGTAGLIAKWPHERGIGNVDGGIDNAEGARMSYGDVDRTSSEVEVEIMMRQEYRSRDYIHFLASVCTAGPLLQGDSPLGGVYDVRTLEDFHQ